MPAITGMDRGTARRTASSRTIRSVGSRAAASPVVPATTTARTPRSTSCAASAALAGASRSPRSSNSVTSATPTPVKTGAATTASYRAAALPKTRPKWWPVMREAPPEVEPVCVVAVHAGVELERIAAVALGLDENPVEQTGPVSGAPSGVARDEVLDVQIVTPRQHVPDVEPGRAGGGSFTVVERRDQPVAGRPLHLVHARTNSDAVPMFGRDSSIASYAPRYRPVGALECSWREALLVSTA